MAIVLAAGATVRAASLQQVTNWNGGVSGLPADVTMHVYVPDKVAPNPPILTAIHYCGGTAAAVFGQASGGGIVKAADQYGFILVLPSSGRCWDVVSSKTRTRDGGGDTHAIVQMVRFALTKYQGNASRVYATGDSSGGMTTQLLLGLYPDIFKAGSSMAGMPAGCGTTTTSPGGYDGACAGGTVTHTAQEWGDIVRKMYPGYNGHRARVQLFHGDADTIIKYPNFTEATKQWTDVLGVATSPTSTQTGVTLGSHQGTRKTWKNSCGFPVLDTFSSSGGDHGPSDALFLAQYVIPFLGLDAVGAVDPEIAQCGSSGTGGAAGTGGTTGSGGNSAASSLGGAGGRTSAGGAPGSGGSVVGAGGRATGGTSSSSASAAQSSGGTATAGGAWSSAGGALAGGTANSLVGGSGAVVSSGVGGSTALGSVPTDAGGALGLGSTIATGGQVGTTPPSSTSVDVNEANTANAEGCSCSVPARPARLTAMATFLGVALLLRRRRGRGVER